MRYSPFLDDEWRLLFQGWKEQVGQRCQSPLPFRLESVQSDYRGRLAFVVSYPPYQNVANTNSTVVSSTTTAQFSLYTNNAFTNKGTLDTWAMTRNTSTASSTVHPQLRRGQVESLSIVQL